MVSRIPSSNESSRKAAMESGVHWRAPVTLIVALLVAVVAATGHHLFYSHLAGTVVRVDEHSFFGFQVSQQQINFAAGTALTFFVNSCLITALSIAYVQVLWGTVRRPGTFNQLGDLDTVFAGLQDILAYRSTVWLGRPLLLVLGLMTWSNILILTIKLMADGSRLLPITSIVPPATLSVELAYLDPAPTALFYVPNVDFTSLSYVGPMPYADVSVGNLRSTYMGPSSEVLKVVGAVGLQGAILPITPPAQNSSWTLDFYGPSVKCESVEGPMRRRMEQNIADWTFDMTPGSSWSFHNCDKPYTYLAWSKQWVNDIALTSLPFVRLLFNEEGIPNPGDRPLTFSTGIESDPGALEGPFFPLYIAVIPSFAQVMRPWEEHAKHPLVSYQNSGVCKLNSTDSNPLGTGTSDTRPTFLQCSTFNASYHASFHFSSGSQTVSLKVDRHEPIHPSKDIVEGLSLNGDHCIRLQSMFITTKCLSDPEILRRLSYTSVLDAFRQQIIGAVSVRVGRLAQSWNILWDTKITNTRLMNTKELDHLHRMSVGSGQSWTMQAYFEDSTQPGRQGLSGMRPQVVNESLATTLEDMFHNITISLMSVEALQPNRTSIYAPPMTNVTFHEYRTVYAYSAQKLWVAYGSAISVTVVAAVIGIATVFFHGVSYSSNFSTIYRVAHAAASMDTDIQSKNGDGADPLPKYLKRARVWLNPLTSAEDEHHSQHSGTEDQKIPVDDRLTMVGQDLQLRVNDAEE